MAKELYLPVKAAGVEFKNPFYVSSGPTARTVTQLEAIEKAGWAGASLKLALDPAPYINRYPRYGIFPGYEALMGFTAEKRLHFSEAVDIMRQAKKKLSDLVLMANITYAGDEDERGWIRMCEAFYEAGADIIELNLCCPNMSFNVETTGGQAERLTGASIGRDPKQVAALVKAIRKEFTAPLIVKLCGEGGMIGFSAREAALAGADGVGSSGNRLGMSPINLENPGKAFYHLQDEISIACLNGGWLKPVAQRDTYEIRNVAGSNLSIFATGGIRTAKDAIEMAMCGGDMAGICTETLMRGYDFIEEIIRETKQWLSEHGYENYGDVRDAIVNQVTAAPELTIYKGWSKVKREGLVAPCYAACKSGVPVQAILKTVADKNMQRAMELAAGAPCESCDAPCEKACVLGRIGRALSIRWIVSLMAKRAEDQGVSLKRPPSFKSSEISAARDILARRKVDLTRDKIKTISDEATAILESGRCQRCGCGEGCAKCIESCCEFALTLDESGAVTVDTKKCVACGMCMNLCPNKNIEMVSTGEKI